MCTYLYFNKASAIVPIINNSEPLNTLPVEVLKVVQEEIINACYEKASEAGSTSPRLTFDSDFIEVGDINGDGLEDYAIKSYDVTCEIFKGVYPEDQQGKKDYGTLNILFKNGAGGFDHVVKNYQLYEELGMFRKSNDIYEFWNYNGVNSIRWNKEHQALIYTNNIIGTKESIPLNESKSIEKKESNAVLWEEL